MAVKKEKNMPQIVNSIYYSANRGGIPRVESESVSVSSTEVTFTFNSDVSFSKNYSGLVLVKINQSLPTDTTTTLPIAFTSKAEGFIFNRFYADCVRKGVPIPWDRCL